MPECINLKKRYGDQYKIDWEECRQGLEQDPWMMQIPCKYGHICPWGDDDLAACTDTNGPIATK